MNFVFDLDGTICFEGKPVTDEVMNVFDQVLAMGHKIIFASARPIRDMLALLDKRFYGFPMIGGNGALVEECGQLLRMESFPARQATQIIEVIKKYEAIHLIDGEWDYSYNGPSNKLLKKIDNLHLAQNIEIEEIPSIYKILIIGAEKWDDLIGELKQVDAEVNIYGQKHVVDISPKGINKFSALQILGIKEKQYVAFGNATSDLPVFKGARHSVMVGGRQVLVPYADEVIPVGKNFNEMFAKSVLALAEKYAGEKVFSEIVK